MAILNSSFAGSPTPLGDPNGRTGAITPAQYSPNYSQQNFAQGSNPTPITGFNSPDRTGYLNSNPLQTPAQSQPTSYGNMPTYSGPIGYLGASPTNSSYNGGFNSFGQPAYGSTPYDTNQSGLNSLGQPLNNNLFGGTGASPTSSAAPAQSTPNTPATSASPGAGFNPSTFGANPYLPAASQTLNGQTTPYAQNQMFYFPTMGTANTLAQQTGGSVNSTNQFMGIPGGTQTANNWVKLQNGLTVDPGALSQFYSQGPQNQDIINKEIQNVLNGFEPGGSGGGLRIDGGGGGAVQASGGTYQVTGNGQIQWVPGGNNVGSTYSYGDIPAAAIGPNLAGYNPGPGSGFTVGGKSIGDYLGTSNLPVGGNGPGASPAYTATPNVPGSGQVSVAGNTPAQNSSFDLNSFLSNLFSPQVQNLYGANPLSVGNSIGNSLGLNLSSLLGNAGSGNNMMSIATLLNALFAQQNTPANGVLSPLFWGKQGGGTGVSPSNFYPSFY